MPVLFAIGCWRSLPPCSAAAANSQKEIAGGPTHSSARIRRARSAPPRARARNAQRAHTGRHRSQAQSAIPRSIYHSRHSGIGKSCRQRSRLTTHQNTLCETTTDFIRSAKSIERGDPPWVPRKRAESIRLCGKRGALSARLPDTGVSAVVDTAWDSDAFAARCMRGACKYQHLRLFGRSMW